MNTRETSNRNGRPIELRQTESLERFVVTTARLSQKIDSDLLAQLQRLVRI